MQDNVLFQDMDLSPEIRKAVDAMGFEQPTPIQALALPPIRAGRDVIGQAHTGSGKTVAFGVPVIEGVDTKTKAVQALILCPTRELAIQVSEELKKLAAFCRGFVSLPVYGGQPIDRQVRSLQKGVHLVIGTPGRVLDHLNRGTLDLSQVKALVMDEADEMLDMGFRDDIEAILKDVPKERQTLLFSATLPPGIRDIIRKYQNNPETITVMHREISVPKIEQFYIEIREEMKLEALTRLIDIENPRLSMVFCNTKRKVDETTAHLQARGYFSDSLHGDMKQNTRDQVMQKFRQNAIDILVATDIAARGIDVQDVDLVFNFDVPMDEEQYVHRIGRTARAGRSGKAYSFVSRRDFPHLRNIQRFTQARIEKTHIPSVRDVEETKLRYLVESIIEVLESENLERYLDMLQPLIEQEFDMTTVSAALLKMQMEKNAVSTETPNQRFDKTGAEAGKVRFFVNVGRDQQIQPRDIIHFVKQQADVAPAAIGRIQIMRQFSFVEVDQQYAEDILAAVSGIRVGNYTVRFELARAR